MHGDFQDINDIMKHHIDNDLRYESDVCNLTNLELGQVKIFIGDTRELGTCDCQGGKICTTHQGDERYTQCTYGSTPLPLHQHMRGSFVPVGRV